MITIQCLILGGFLATANPGEPLRAIPTHFSADAAVELGREIEQRLESPTDPRLLLTRLAEWGNLAEENGEFASAIECLEIVLRALDETGLSEDPLTVRVLATLTRAWRGIEPQSLSLTHGYDARARQILANLGPRDDLWAEVLTGWANQVRYEHGAAASLPVYRQALARRRAAGDPLATADAMIWLAWLEHHQGASNVAPVVRQALAILDNAGAEVHPLRTVALDLLASDAVARGDLQGARRLIDESIGLRDRVRPHMLPGMRNWAASSQILLMEVALKLGDGGMAWEALRHGIGDRTLDAMVRVDAPTQSADLRGAAQRLADRRRAFRPRFVAWRDRVDGAPTTAQMVVEMARVAIDYGTWIEHWQARVRDVGPERPPLPPLDDNTAFIGWCVSGGSFMGPATASAVHAVIQRGAQPPRWVELGQFASREGFDAWREPYVDRILTLSRAGRFPDIGADARLDSLSALIYRRLMAPLEPWLTGVDRLVVIPGSGFQDLIVEALIDDVGSVVGDRFAITYAASPDAYALASRDAAPSGRNRPTRALVIGDPDYSGTGSTQDDVTNSAVDASVMRSVLNGDATALAKLPRLRFSGAEAEAVARLVGSGTVLTRTDATERRLVDMARLGSLARYDILHFATHAFFETKSGQLGTLILSIPQEQDETDGLVTPSDVELSWELDAELAVFSGCQTGPQIQGQEQTGGMLLSAVAAGARSVLASRWKVHDEATYLLMTRFYENLTGHYEGERLGYRATAMRKDESLQEARRWLRAYRSEDGRQPFVHPFHWSAFYLSGNPRGL